jgi:hypothetical protein
VKSSPLNGVDPNAIREGKAPHAQDATEDRPRHMVHDDIPDILDVHHHWNERVENMMTRKHFESLAASIARLNLFDHDAAYEMACEVADACAKDNPRFDRGRFFEACGFPEGNFSELRGSSASLSVRAD